jgi:ABC-type methionine transport system permease subunit
MKPSTFTSRLTELAFQEFNNQDLEAKAKEEYGAKRTDNIFAFVLHGQLDSVINVTSLKWPCNSSESPDLPIWGSH